MPWGPSDSGGATCEVRTGDGWRVGVTESGGRDRFAEPLYSTNQFVVRVGAVRRVFGLPGDVVTAVQRFVDRQPFHVERKKVGDADALQLQQRINGSGYWTRGQTTCCSEPFAAIPRVTGCHRGRES